MLKKLATFYLIIEVLHTGFRLFRAIEMNAFQETSFWVAWPIHLLSLVAVLGFLLKRQFFNSAYWKIILICFISLRIYELVPHGLYPEEVTGIFIFVISVQYLWLVVPPAMATWYLSFKFKNNEKL